MNRLFLIPLLCAASCLAQPNFTGSNVTAMRFNATPVMQTAPSISVSFSNYFSTSNSVPIFGLTNVLGSSAATMTISNAWPWTLTAGQTGQAAVYWTETGVSADGSVDYAAASSGLMIFTNSTLGSGCIFTNAPTFGGFNPPTTFTGVANSTGWAEGESNANSTSTQKTIIGTVIYTIH